VPALATAAKTILIAATLGVVVWLLVSRTRNPLRNPLVILVMCFVSTLIGWLAVLGTGYLFTGTAAVRVSPHVVIIAVLLGGIAILALSAASGSRASGLVALPGAAALVLASWLAAVGLEHVSGPYLSAACVPWVLSSLSLAFAIYLLAAIQRTRPKGGGDAQPTGLHREDDPRRQDDA